MKRLFYVVILMVAQQASALDCDGHVTEVVDWPGKCNGQFAYKTDNNNAKWFCSLSDKSNSLILAAYVSKNKVRTRVAAPGETCENLSTNYLVPDFIRGLNAN